MSTEDGRLAMALERIASDDLEECPVRLDTHRNVRRSHRLDSLAARSDVHRFAW